MEKVTLLFVNLGLFCYAVFFSLRHFAEQDGLRGKVCDLHSRVSRLKSAVTQIY